MRRAAAITLLLLAACGSDDVDLTGVYLVTSNVMSSPCGTDMPVSGGPAYLKFEKGDLFGTTYFLYDGCDDEAGTMCGGATVFDGLFEPIDNGWRGVTSSAPYSKTQMKCLLGYTEATAILNGNQLVIEDAHYADEASISEVECTNDEAEKRGTTMTCEEHARIEATKR